MTQTNSRRLRTLLLTAAAVAVIYVAGRGVSSHAFAPADRSAARELRLTDLDGQGWTLNEQRGKVVLVNYWATWCPPCVRETPMLARVYRELAPRGFAAVGIAMDEGAEADVRDFVKRNSVPYPVAVAGNSGVGSDIEALPTSLLLDRQGRLAKTYRGMPGESELRTDIERLLTE